MPEVRQDRLVTQPERTTIYTDGACQGNPGPGGWAWAVPGGRWATGAEAKSTNQRMEIAAALNAVQANDEPLEIVSDSTYVVNCFRDRWWEGWIARGWVNKAKKPVANRDLWEPLIDEVRRRGNVVFKWVKGHSDDPMNDLVDRLAVEAAGTQRGRSGEKPPAPDELGPPDRPGAPPDPMVPAGHKLAIVGHRPPELGGYQANPVADDVRSRLAEIIGAKREVHDDLVVLTGLGLGAEQLGAVAAVEAGVPFYAVLPYPEPESVWPAAAQASYRKLLDAADGRILVQNRKPTSKVQAGGALSRRDAWLARNADEAIAVWNGDDPGVGKQVRTLQDQLGEEDVWVVAPAPE
jgi:ribonuclease HI